MKEAVVPLMFSAKQGNYWYHFYNVFGTTRSLTGDWTRVLSHSKPALGYRGGGVFFIVFSCFSKQNHQIIETQQGKHIGNCMEGFWKRCLRHFVVFATWCPLKLQVMTHVIQKMSSSRLYWICSKFIPLTTLCLFSWETKIHMDTITTAT